MMKKMFLAIAAAVMMSTTMMAQDGNDNARRPRMDRTEMVKKRTDDTAKRYGLNEEQTAQLLELNTKYSMSMGPRRGPRPGDGRGRRMNMDSARMQKPEPNGNMERRADGPRGREMGNGREEWRKQMEEYDAELQKIMTEEQFKAYKADQEKRMKEGPGRRGNRQ